MTELTVGVRELKENLSEYLAKAKKGQTIVITSHGKVVAQLIPGMQADDPDARLQALVDAGIISWSGRKLKLSKPAIVNTSGKLASDIISGMRDESLY